MAATQDDDYAADPVPDAKRLPWQLAFFAVLGVATALFFMQVTSILANKFGSVTAIIGIIYASILCSLVSIVIARYSIVTGFGVSLLARSVLGFRGASLFSLIYAMNYFVYFIAEAKIMGSSVTIGHLPSHVLLPLITIGMMPLVWFGMKLLARLQIATFVLYAILLAAALAISYQHDAGGRGWLSYDPTGQGVTLHGLVVMCGTMNSVIFIAALLLADYARFVRKQDLPRAILGLGIAYPLFCFILSGSLGLWFGVRYNQADPGLYFAAMLGAWGTVFAFATQLRINLGSMYTGSLALVNLLKQALGIDVSRHAFIILFGGSIAIALYLELFSNLTMALNVIGMFTTCFTCLLIADIFLVRPNHLPAHELPYREGEIPALKWPAVLSLLAATIGGCFLQAGILGEAMVWLASIAAAVFQTVLYVYLSRAQRPAALAAA